MQPHGGRDKVIERILPAGAIAVEAWSDPVSVELFPEERASVARAVEKRRREFATARGCAREALGRLGFAAVPIASGPQGEPCWPAGVVGSITHCDGYRACAVARSERIVTIGIDAEPHAALPEGLLESIARPEELRALNRLRDTALEVYWDRLLFSAKESVYKAWFPLTRKRLGFEDAVLAIDACSNTFTARMLVAAPLPDNGSLGVLCGRWTVRNDIIVTAVAMDRLQWHPRHGGREGSRRPAPP